MKFETSEPWPWTLCITVEKITVFDFRNNDSLSTLNQRQNLTLKQRWFWAGTKTNFVLMLYQQTQHVELTSTGKNWRIFTTFGRALLISFRWAIIDVILMYFFDIILMQLQRYNFNVLLLVWVWKTKSHDHFSASYR